MPKTNIHNKLDYIHSYTVDIQIKYSENRSEYTVFTDQNTLYLHQNLGSYKVLNRGERVGNLYVPCKALECCGIGVNTQWNTIVALLMVQYQFVELV